MNNRLILVLVGAVVLITAPFVAYYLSPSDVAGQEIIFSVAKGEGVRDIAQALGGAGLVKSPAMFTLYSALTGKAHALKPGQYLLSEKMSLPAIAALLARGPKEDVEILVREGETLAEVEKSLVSNGVLKAGALTRRKGKSLEGFFFPDTYRFFRNSDPEDVIKRFIGNFYEKAAPVLKDASDFYPALIIASIIEKEVPFSEERPIVSGILYRRLAIGMALQVDAAPETYDRPGLPKTPISNPGLDAIRAAAHPVKSEYLYYLSDPKTHKTIFSKTFDEHVANKFKYLR